MKKQQAVSHTYNSCNSPNFISFYKKMGQFDKKFRCNKFVQVIDQSQPGVFYLQKWWISVLHSQKWWSLWKCALFIEKITSFYKKNSNWHTYKKLYFSNFQKTLCNSPQKSPILFWFFISHDSQLSVQYIANVTSFLAPPFSRVYPIQVSLPVECMND